MILVEILFAHITVIAKPILLPDLNAFVKNIARHTKNRSVAPTVALSATSACYRKTYVHGVQITPSTILEAAQVILSFGSLSTSWTICNDFITNIKRHCLLELFFHTTC